MPKYGLDEIADDSKPKPACSGIREDLRDCLLKSDCVVKNGKTPKECLMLRNDPSIPEECQSLRIAFFECKRSLVAVNKVDIIYTQPPNNFTFVNVALRTKRLSTPELDMRQRFRGRKGY